MSVLAKWCGRVFAVITILVVPVLGVCDLEKEGPEFWVNTSNAGYEAIPKIGVDAQGNTLVVWSSEAEYGSNEGAAYHGQRYNAHGDMVGDEFVIVPSSEKIANIHAENAYPHFDMAMRGDGSFVLAWSREVPLDDGSGDYDIDLVMQRFDANAEPIEEPVIVAQTSAEEALPRLATEESGVITIAWQAYFGGSESGVWVSRYGSDGMLLGESVQVSGGYIGDVALNGEGSALVSWAGSNELDSDGSPAVFAKIYDQNGQAVTGDINVSGETGSFISTGDIRATVLPNNDFAMAWTGYEEGSDSSIQARVVTASGALLGEVLAVTPGAMSSPSYFEEEVEALVVEGDYLYVFWSRYDEVEPIVVALLQRVNVTDGSLLNEPFQVSGISDVEEGHVSAALTATGSLTVVWETWHDTNNGPDIYGQRLITLQAESGDSESDEPASSSSSSGGGGSVAWLGLFVLSALSRRRCKGK